VGDTVIDLATRKLELNPNDLIALSRIAIAYANKGTKDKAVDAIETIAEVDPEDGMALYNCAGAYSVLGMKEEALRLFTISLEKGTANLIEWIENDPYLDPIRTDPEFRQALENFSV
jgi:tetratricopeptide (TPR) repeat protein